MILAGTKTAVIGIGKSGFAAVDLLLEQGAQVRALDLRPTEEMRAALASRAVELCGQRDGVPAGTELIVISPGVPGDLPLLADARRAGLRVIGELELAGYFLKGRTIGITGSNGKTTTTALTGHILRAAGIACQVGGNIGIPPTAMVAASREDRWNVLELSSFQLETIQTFRAHIAAALNVTGNHLNRHHTFANYAAAKARLFDKQWPGDAAVLNADNETTAAYARNAKGPVVWFSSTRRVSSGLWLEGGAIFLDGEKLIESRDIRLRGIHNIENVMAAAAAARLAGAPPDRIAAAIPGFTGVEHRLEFVRELDGVSYFNDSKATSVDATLKAIASFDGSLWVILGGQDKDSDYSILREPLRRHTRMALLIGEATPKIEAALRGAVPLIACGTLDAAVGEARARARAGDTVLFAPACASFDQFRDFEHRGDAFKVLVASLGSGGD